MVHHGLDLGGDELALGGRVDHDRGMVGCERHWPGRAVRISAQAHLERFYNGFGFVRVGENHIEDTIPHVQMLRSAA